MLLADKAYDANAIRAFARSEGGWANIPSRRTRKDRILLQPVSLPRPQPGREVLQPDQAVRRIATRYEKLAENFLAFVKLAAVRLWVRVNQSAPSIMVDRFHFGASSIRHFFLLTGYQSTQ